MFRSPEREAFLRAAAQLPGIYVPSLYDVTYHDDGTVAAITPRGGAPKVVTKRIVEDLDRAYFPTKTIVPTTEIVHDRSNLEVFRGCIRGCSHGWSRRGHGWRSGNPFWTLSP